MGIGCELAGVFHLYLGLEVSTRCGMGVFCEYFGVPKGGSVDACNGGVLCCGGLLFLNSTTLSTSSLPRTP